MSIWLKGPYWCSGCQQWGGEQTCPNCGQICMYTAPIEGCENCGTELVDGICPQCKEDYGCED